jgi:hypothetical protein
MRSDSDKKFDSEAFMKRVEEMLLMDALTEEQKICILQKLLAIADEE